MWGLYDKKDNCWLGDENGPKPYEDKTIARIAAQVIADQLGYGELSKRIEARELPDYNLKLKDSVDTKRTALESIRRIEGFNDKDEPIGEPIIIDALEFGPPGKA